MDTVTVWYVVNYRGMFVEGFFEDVNEAVSRKDWWENFSGSKHRVLSADAVIVDGKVVSVQR